MAKLRARLIESRGAIRCSVCMMPFEASAAQSISRKFTEHVHKAHQPYRTTEDSSQAALGVREATGNK